MYVFKNTYCFSGWFWDYNSCRIIQYSKLGKCCSCKPEIHFCFHWKREHHNTFELWTGWSTVRKVQITKRLTDVEVDEGADAVFICEVNYADEEAEWFLDDKPLFSNEVNVIQHVNKTHTITLKNLAPQDGGKITFKMREEKQTVCLKVKGILAWRWRFYGALQKYSTSWTFSHYGIRGKSILCGITLKKKNRKGMLEVQQTCAMFWWDQNLTFWPLHKILIKYLEYKAWWW